MNNKSIRAAIRVAGLLLPLIWTSGSLAAQMHATPQATAYCVSVSTATLNQKTPAAVLPAGEMMATDQANDVTVADLVTAQDAFAIVNGVSVDDPAPNTRLDLPGVGYVVLNEQVPTSGGITVNMIHVVLQQPVLGVLGGVTGYQTTGDIIVGSASSSVN